MRPVMLKLALGIATLAACGSATEPGFFSDGFSVRAENGSLVLRNGSESPIHYVAIEEETSDRMDLYYDPEAWPELGPGEEIRLPYEQVPGYAPGATQIRIYWWTKGEQRAHFIVDLR